MITRNSAFIGIDDPQLSDRQNLLYMMKSVTSTLPAEITYVDYDKCCVDCEVTIATEITEGRFVPYPQFSEVPLMIYSGNNGKARQTMPIKVGDVVELSFADRDTVNWLCSDGRSEVNPDSSYPLSMGGQHYVLVAKPCITLQANARPIDPDNVVTENEHSRIIQTPDGATTITNSKGSTLTLSADNTLSFDNGVATLVIQDSGELLFSGGNATINGAVITKSGNVITAGGVNLDEFKKAFDAHIHGGVKAGSDNSGKLV